MAKRKRLTPANPVFLDAGPALEVKSAGARPPIADVATDAAATSALEVMTQEFTRARESGRMIIKITLDQIKQDYLVRDRIAADDDDMAALVESIRRRGQQTPIEVAAIGAGTYGLISGWRRCHAIARLQEDGAGDGGVLALVRTPNDASDAYVAMIEENEIRVGLSYYERARIVQKALEQRLFSTAQEGLRTLFESASRAKRSKIGSFLTLVAALDGHLRFPQAIGERMGLRLAKLLDGDAGAVADLRATLEAAGPVTATAEQSILSAWIADRGQSDKKPAAPKSTKRELRQGLQVEYFPSSGKLVLSGQAMTPDLRARLLTWLERQS